MKKELLISYDEHENISELSIEDRALLERARSSCDNAYAPYSDFYVGAAVKLKNGKIIIGNNQENAAYPSGLCAERVAVFAASAMYPAVAIEKLAITALSPNIKVNFPVTPCGACRQAIAEYEMKFSSDIKIIMQGESGPIYVFKSIAILLPLIFHLEELKK